LFGALRAVKIEYTANEEVNESRQQHIAAVLDVFDVFLATDNVVVFANAAVDCILCLLKYVRGPGYCKTRVVRVPFISRISRPWRLHEKWVAVTIS